ncbi:MAG: hypothetical protein WB760_33000 [Xanthobacteraceae bacterium]
MKAWLYARYLLDRVGEIEKALTENPRGCAAVFERYNSTLPDEPEFAFGIGNDGPVALLAMPSGKVGPMILDGGSGGRCNHAASPEVSSPRHHPEAPTGYQFERLPFG